jgi:hypothetical protein
MKMLRRNTPVAWSGCALAVVGAIWLTGCPKRIDVSPEGNPSNDGGQPSSAAPAEGGDTPTTTSQRRQTSIPIQFVAQTTVQPRESRVARGGSAADRSTERPAYEDGERHVDPVAANGEIFVNWPPPQVAILFSGEQDGYIEPCGCAGLHNQKGGLSRRHTLIKQLTEKGWPVVPLDLGGQVKRIGPQPEIKFRHALESLIKLGYQAVAIGPRDLRVDMLGVAVNLDAAANPLVCANVALVEFESPFTKRFRVIEAAGKKIGVTSILGKAQQEGLENLDFVQLVDPAVALKEVVPQLQAAGCDYYVLLSHASPDESQALAKAFPIFDFVLTAGGAEEPPAATAAIPESRARLVEVGHKGMYVAVVGIYEDGGKRTFRYQRVPLDSRFPDSPEMHQMMVTYQQELETIGLADLGLAGARHESGREFVGTAKCAECHADAMAIWEITPHSHATETLVDRVKPPRHFDPECLSCHATGWNPQKYFPYSSGFLGLEKTPHMVANGCENCHGPGSSHVAAESGDEKVNEEEKLRRRAEMRLSLVENEGNKPGQTFGKVVQSCMQCHDLDNSPDFDFQVYWPEVEHYGKE